MPLISNEVSTNPLLPAPHQNTKLENAMKILLHQMGPKLLERNICNSAVFIYLGIQPPPTQTATW